MKSVWVIVAVIVFMILIGMNLQIAPKEHFAAAPAPTTSTTIQDGSIQSMDLYLNNKSLMCDTMYYAGSMLSDAKSLLHPRWCLRWNPTQSAQMDAHDYLNTLATELESTNMYVESFSIDSDDMEPVFVAIQKKLFYFAVNRETPKSIQGPVFIVMGQAPYYTDIYGDVIHHQPFQRDAYGMNPTLPQQAPPQGGLRLYIHIVFPMYDKNKKAIDVSASAFDFKNHYKSKMVPLKALKIDDAMCRIKCLNSSGLLCGCVNQNAPYKSRCMADDPSITASSVTPQNKNVFADHSMLYRINENSPRVSPIFSKTYYEDIKI
jgi:PBP1b-binding outer membrane lipoprotein LpoB